MKVVVWLSGGLFSIPSFLSPGKKAFKVDFIPDTRRGLSRPIGNLIIRFNDVTVSP